MKIAIIGYYGHNNLGDELNLYEMMKLLKQQYPLCDITVFSGGLSYLYYQSDYHLVLADTMSLAEYRNTLNSFDMVIIGGGGLLFLGANYFDFLMEGIKVPYLFSRMGVDDRILSQTVCEEYKNILEKAYDVTVRTSFDQALAQKHLGIHCCVVPEAIWNYEAEKNALPSHKKKILISINQYASEYSKSIEHSLNNLKTENTVYTVSMQDAADDFYHNINSTPPGRVILPEAVSLHQKASYLASSDLVITSRLHAGLIAISHGVPLIMLKSTPKVKFIMQELELSSLFLEDSLTEQFMEEVLLDEKLPENLRSKASEMKAKASTNLIPE